MEKVICPICLNQPGNFCFSKNSFDFYVCHSCGLLFVYPLPEDFSSVYDKEYFYNSLGNKAYGYTNYDEDKKPMRDVFVDYLKRFEVLSAGRNIFDAGAATGYFLDLARERGWQTAGVEISLFAGEEARRRGHEIFIGSAESVSPKVSNHVVTMWDVLEHVRNPNITMATVNRLLENGGLVAINTPDAGSLWARIFGKRWHLIVPPEHLHYFSKKSLKHLLVENGFEIIEWGRISKRFSIPYVLKILYNWQNLALWKFLLKFFDRPFWRKIFVPINFHDNIFVLAKKIREV